MLPVRDSSASLRDRSGGTPTGEPRISGSALRRPDRPDEAKSKAGFTSVISKTKQNQAINYKVLFRKLIIIHPV